MSEFVTIRRDEFRARLRQLESVIAADNDDHDALADVRGWMETVLAQPSACKVCGGGGYVIADPPDGVGDCPACNTALAQPEAQPEQQPVRWMAREDWDNAWKQSPVYLEMMDSEDVPLYAGPFTSTPVRWEYRWLNPGGDPTRDGYMGWSLLEPRTAGQNQSQAIHEMMGYRYNDKPVYEVRPLYAGPALPNK